MIYDMYKANEYMTTGMRETCRALMRPQTVTLLH